MLRFELKRMGKAVYKGFECLTGIAGYQVYGNIIEAGCADKSTYGFFGESIDCVIIEPEKDEDE